MTKHSLVVLPGDGVGPEVIAEALRVIAWLQHSRGFDCDVRQHDYGYHVFREIGSLYRPGVIEDALGCDAVLFGAMGGPEYDEIPPAVRRQAAFCASGGRWKSLPICARHAASWNWPTLFRSSGL